MAGTGTDVLVIGGGVHGCSTAFHLACRGATVVLLEADFCGRHASGVNAGGVRTLNRPLPEIALALASRDMWHDLAELLGETVGFHASGQLKVAESEDDVALLQARIARLEAHGWHHEAWIDRDAVRTLVPAISPHVTGGIWVAQDGHALPYRTVTAFRRAAQRCGARVYEHTAVRRIEARGSHWLVHTASGLAFEACHIVNAAGAWSGEIARQLGEPVPVEPGGLMLAVTQRVPPFVAPVLGAASRPLSFKQFDNGTVVIGGALHCPIDFAAKHAEIDFRRLAQSARTVLDLFPFLKDVPLNRAWSGLEAFTPDKLPVIGPSRVARGVTHAFGFSSSGFQLGPIVGRLVSQLVLDGKCDFALDAFAVDRFAAVK